MVQSIDRAMAIIHILASDSTRIDWSITDLAAETSLPVSTLHRLLHSLIKHRLVVQIQETKQYRLGSTWMEMGLRLLENINFRDVARPIMERLAIDVEESIYLNIPHASDGIVIEKVDGPLKVRIAENLGIRIPIHIGAPNKVLLAYMKESQRMSLIETIQNRTSLLEQLKEIKQNGYAISRGERTEGTISIASPILDYQQNIVAAISINAPSFRIEENRLAELIQKVKAAAEEISLLIGGK